LTDTSLAMGRFRLPTIRPLLQILLAMTLSGCANWHEDAGVENYWRADDAPRWEPGNTTSDDVMAFLGPPSQIVDLQNQLVFYYMKESVSGQGYYFLFYNTSESQTRYDRAIFFFDPDGVLVRYAYSNESITPEE
jgi:hypothetical protein